MIRYFLQGLVSTIIQQTLSTVCVKLCPTHVRFGCEQADDTVSTFNDSLESSGTG